MKKIYVLFAIISLFMVQLCCVGTVYAVSEGNIDLDPSRYNNGESYNSTTYSCGNKMVTDIPGMLLDTVHVAYMVIQVVVPIILVIMGMITLLKSITAGKEDEIKKAQMNFVKKLISGALVFFIFVIVKLLISFSATSDRAPKIIDCMDCFLNGKDNCESINYSTNSSDDSSNDYIWRYENDEEFREDVNNLVDSVQDTWNNIKGVFDWNWES